MKRPNITHGHWHPEGDSVFTENRLVCRTAGDTDQQAEANAAFIAASVKMAEFANTIQFIAAQMAAKAPPKLGEWDWTTLAEQGKKALLEAGYTKE